MSKLFSTPQCITAYYNFATDGIVPLGQVRSMKVTLPNFILVYHCCVTARTEITSDSGVGEFSFGWRQVGVTSPTQNTSAFQNLVNTFAYFVNFPVVENNLLTNPISFTNSAREIIIFSLVDDILTGTIQLDLFYIDEKR